MSVLPKRNGTKPGKKTIKVVAGRRNRRAGRKAQVISTTVAVRATPRRRPNRNRRRRNDRTQARALTGRGSTRTNMRSKRMCTVEEDEFIAAVNGSVGFANTAYPINPGQAGTFPWLAKQAAQWEKYRFNMLEFYYKRDVSEFATNGTTGKVIMSVDFDASDAPPSTKQQIEDTDPRVDGMPSENLRMPLRSGDLHSLYPTLYVRPGGLPGATDIKTYDAGNFNIATQGNQNTSEIGELRVKYSVTFSVPVLESSTAAPANNSVATFSSTVGEAIVTATNYQLLLGGVTQSGNLGIVNTVGSLVCPAGNYLVEAMAVFTYTGSSTASALALRKGAADLVPVNASETYTAGTQTVITVNQSGFYSSDGTAATALAVRVIGTFSTGTGSVQGTLRITAI